MLESASLAFLVRRIVLMAYCCTPTCFEHQVRIQAEASCQRYTPVLPRLLLMPTVFAPALSEKVGFDDSQSVDEPQETRRTLGDRETVSLSVVHFVLSYLQDVTFCCNELYITTEQIILRRALHIDFMFFVHASVVPLCHSRTKRPSCPHPPTRQRPRKVGQELASPGPRTR